MIGLLACLQVWAGPADYVWTSPSRNSSESMPLGGGDVGMNVWVDEQTGDVLFYLARSGCFDENNTLLKLGRFRLHTSRRLDMRRFTQRLVLSDGYMVIGDGGLWITLWADVEKPVVHVEVVSEKMKTDVEVTYESWRTQDHVMTKREAFQSSWKFAAPQGLTTHRDSIAADAHGITFFHRNPEHTIFDDVVAQQQMESVKSQMYNPLKNLTFGGRMMGDGCRVMGDVCRVMGERLRVGELCSGIGRWTLRSERPQQHHHVQIVLATVQGSMDDWQAKLSEAEHLINIKKDKKASRLWWNEFWERSFIASPTPPKEGLATQQALPSFKGEGLFRNYALFRYMLGCNAKGKWPTKFNGGLFTFDPEYVKEGEEYRLSPDFRNWGGGVHTAQNQRLVYWPMLKSGDFDLMKPQLDFYLRCLRNAELRSEVYWHHAGACFTEQLENFGLPNPAEYGKKRPEGFDPGMERNAWLEYEWDTCLEFCMMALLARDYGGMDIEPYMPMIRSCLRFFDEHYQYLANLRGAKRLDGNGKLVLYPGSGGETFKGAYNATSTVAALHTVAQAVGDTALLSRLPAITVRDGMIAPALHYERVQNVETTQLYPVFPWRIYGLGRPDLDVAIKTYQQDSLALKFRSHVGWKQDNIWAACLGLTDEARRLTELKLADGPYRFPAFWGPGYDWSPDHNWGGSAMIGLQEMLLQEKPDGELLLFPAWPREWDVHFRLHASGGRIVEAVMKDGRVVSSSVTRMK